MRTPTGSAVLKQGGHGATPAPAGAPQSPASQQLCGARGRGCPVCYSERGGLLLRDPQGLRQQAPGWDEAGGRGKQSHPQGTGQAARGVLTVIFSVPRPGRQASTGCRPVLGDQVHQRRVHQ